MKANTSVAIVEEYIIGVVEQDNIQTPSVKIFLLFAAKPLVQSNPLLLIFKASRLTKFLLHHVPIYMVHPSNTIHHHAEK